MSRIAPLTLDLAMQPRDFVDLVPPSFRSPLLVFETPLNSNEIVPCLGAEVFTQHSCTLTRRDHIRDAEINAHVSARGCQRRCGHVDALHVQPPLRAFSLDGDRLRFT